MQPRKQAMQSPKTPSTGAKRLKFLKKPKKGDENG